MQQIALLVLIISIAVWIWSMAVGKYNENKGHKYNDEIFKAGHHAFWIGILAFAIWITDASKMNLADMYWGLTIIGLIMYMNLDSRIKKLEDLIRK